LAILEDSGRGLRDKGEAEDGQSRQRQHDLDLGNAWLPFWPGQRRAWHLIYTVPSCISNRAVQPALIDGSEPILQP
jgi:hypothetical protein